MSLEDLFLFLRSYEAELILAPHGMKTSINITLSSAYGVFVSHLMR